jgi:chemotaxis signal transduction protein
MSCSHLNGALTTRIYPVKCRDLTPEFHLDTVSEVNNIKADEIDVPPVFGTSVETDYILGMTKKEDGVKILLDIDRVLQTDELVRVLNAA